MIFRLYEGGSGTYQDWNESPAFPYNSSNRDSIEDPNGASARHEITSIPSPFARIDLVKNAFKTVAKGDLDGDSIFHKMVSDALDVGEIFFNIDKYKQQVEIITWDSSQMIQELKDSDVTGHYYLADALEKYMESDAKAYNFSKLKNIYLLNFLNGPDEINIIGATSPSTIFFSSANELDYVTDAINFGQDKPFDNEFQPLYKRDFEYIKFWFVLRKSIADFAEIFPEVNDYLERTLRQITDVKKKDILRKLTATDASNYSTIDVIAVQQTNQVEVLGYELYKNCKKADSSESQFTIKSSRGSLRPFVLPVEAGNKYSSLIYTSDTWGNTNAAPYLCKEQDLAKRILPNEGAVYPFVTISDFLEDTVIKVGHKLNTCFFFDGNANIKENKLSYLLPIKPLFFEFFTVDDLKSEFADGKRMFEMEVLNGGSVKVVLRVPIVGNNRIKYIEYVRLYYANRSADISENTNEGNVEEFDFAGAIMPNVKFSVPNEAIYKISCVSTYSSSYKLAFYEGNREIQNVGFDCRNKDQAETYKQENYTIERSNFEYIQVRNRNGAKAVLVPVFAVQSSVNSFEFAIDLGTSNTHVEYRKNGENLSQPFSYEGNGAMITHMFLPSYLSIGGVLEQEDLNDEYSFLERDLLPNALGENCDFKFPTRTVLSYGKTVDWNDRLSPFGMINIPLTYDKRKNLQTNNYKCNIKWGKGDELRMMESFVDTLMLMIRNMVIQNKGKLDRTKITWFYPISMAPKRLNQFRNTWDAAFSRYFGVNATDSMTESSAPIHYYFRKQATATNLVNVDIGGGTTDIAFAKNKEIQFVTSFKFAANALFENAFSDISTSNGIVDFYKQELRTLLAARNKKELVEIFESTNNTNYSSNMASFMFALKDNSIVKDMDSKSIDFNYLLQSDENFKISFILFYTSIIYHIAKIVKEKGLQIPRHIAFSGNGSKVVKIISGDVKILSKFTKTIFEKVTGQECRDGLDILGLDLASNPKEATCKGGLYGSDSGTDDRSKIVVLKAMGNSFVNEEDTYDGIDDLYIEKAAKSVKEFYDFIFNTLNSAFNFDDHFGVSAKSLSIARDVCYRDIETYIKKGIAQRVEESDGRNKIEETLFFYPVKGALNRLSLEIYGSITNKE